MVLNLGLGPVIYGPLLSISILLLTEIKICKGREYFLGFLSVCHTMECNTVCAEHLGSVYE